MSKRPQYQKRPISERFEEKIMADPNSGCWLWTGCVNNMGYGDFRINRKRVYAHRYSYRQHVGQVPAGFCVLHKCDTPSCCNPNHLFLGTKKQNTADMIAKDRHPRGMRSGTAKIDDDQVRGIRRSSDTYVKLAAKYGLSIASISNIKTWKCWSHVSAT